MNKKQKLTLVLVVLLIAGYFVFNYLMTGGARDLENEKSEFNISAIDVFQEFSINNKVATAKYINKAVEISGKVSSVNGNVIVLDEKVSCLLQVPEKIELNSQVKIKGRVTGYDDLLEELRLDQCILVKKD